MTNIIKESKKLGLCADFYSNLSYYARNKMWDFESLKTEAEENGDFDAALEYYKQYIELKKVTKQAEDFYNELCNKDE